MSPRLQRRAEEIFKEVIGADPNVRPLMLASRCSDDRQLAAEVLALLAAADEPSGVLDRSAPSLMGVAAPPPPESAGVLLPPGTRIGAYQIESVLGVGGMGAVYVAQQQRPRRTVALKLVRPGLASESVLRRFAFEAEVLGRLQHPGIAQIIEAGTADTGGGPQPFFAMELLHGASITQHAQALRLTMPQRLRLMALVCDAVEHAHRRGVVHRDLKPANILLVAAAEPVSDAENTDTDAARIGQPKILDFGVALAVSGADAANRLTQHHDRGSLIGTLAYMSPEQVGGDSTCVDGRADVYALGVILFELLTGRLPHDLSQRSLPEATRAIVQDEPARPAALNPGLRGDLDNIIRTAIEKDPRRRYQTAADLAADLRAFLANRPISARPPTLGYRVAKFTRRNRALVIGAAAALLFLIAGLITSAIAWQRAAADRDNARKAQAAAEASAAAALTESQRAGEMAMFLKSTLLSIDPAVAKGRDTTVLQEALGRAAAQIRTNLSSQPAVRGDMYAVIAQVYGTLGRPQLAAPLFAEALALLEQAPPTVQTAEATAELGFAMIVNGDLTGAEQCLGRALALTDQLGPAARTARLSTLRYLANLGRLQSRLGAAEQSARAALALAESANPPRPDLRASALHDLGLVLSDAARHSEAEPVLRQAIALAAAEFGDGDLRVARMLSNLAADLYEQERYDDSIAEMERSLVILRRQLGDQHAVTANATATMALAQLSAGRPEQARALIEHAIITDRAVYASQSPVLANHLVTLGLVRAQLHDPDGAIAAYSEAVDILNQTTGPAHTSALDASESLIRTLLTQGENEHAAEVARTTLDHIQTAMQGADVPPTLPTRRAGFTELLAYALGEWGQAQAAEGRIEPALRLVHESSGLYKSLAQNLPSATPEQLAMRQEFDGRLGVALVTEAVILASSQGPGRQGAGEIGIPEQVTELLARAETLCLPGASRTDSSPQQAITAAERMVSIFDQWQKLQPNPRAAANLALWQQRLEAARAGK